MERSRFGLVDSYSNVAFLITLVRFTRFSFEECTISQADDRQRLLLDHLRWSRNPLLVGNGWFHCREGDWTTSSHRPSKFQTVEFGPGAGWNRNSVDRMEWVSERGGYVKDWMQFADGSVLRRLFSVSTGEFEGRDTLSFGCSLISCRLTLLRRSHPPPPEVTLTLLRQPPVLPF